MDEQHTGDASAREPPGGSVDDLATEGPPSRDRVLEAAARVFAHEGLDAPMPAVASAAGVGVGTIYRAFGSKEELVAALAADRVEWFGTEAAAAAREPDAWHALVDLLARTAERQAEDYVVTEALAWIFDHPRVRDAQERASASARELMGRAKEEGRLRKDFAPEDLPMLFAALGAAQQSMPRGSPAWKRLFTMVIDGLSPEGATQLTDRPLTPDDIAQAAKERRERRVH
jgi:AcrR family transcriptional regulator